jgi:dTDP-4-dehydrorhamnose 3,5-epimerase-like enzyme
MTSSKTIFGGLHQDIRGIVSFVNDFDLTPVKRFYQIHHTETETFRGWQGHQKESKWFYCSQGGFIINCVKLQKWDNIGQNEIPITIGTEGSDFVEYFELKSESPCVLYVPSGYATGFKALSPHSTLLVYSDLTVSESQADDFRFDINTWAFKNAL